MHKTLKNIFLFTIRNFHLVYNIFGIKPQFFIKNLKEWGTSFAKLIKSILCVCALCSRWQTLISWMSGISIFTSFASPTYYTATNICFEFSIAYTERHHSVNRFLIEVSSFKLRLQKTNKLRTMGILLYQRNIIRFISLLNYTPDKIVFFAHFLSSRTAGVTVQRTCVNLYIESWRKKLPLVYH